jgi:hypothetical protein
MGESIPEESHGEDEPPATAAAAEDPVVKKKTTKTKKSVELSDEERNQLQNESDAASVSSLLRKSG